MPTTRREFLQSSLAAAAVCSLPQSKPQSQPAGGGKKILILGGTIFLGPAVIAAATRRGHTLTLFNRDKSRPGKFKDQYETLKGNRDPKKDEGLKALEGREWDAVVDTSGHFPRWVRASCEVLAKCRHYTYISSISAYADNTEEGQDETARAATLKDPDVETMGKNYENYGGLKAACEAAAEKALPGRACNIRPGFIVGPEDTSDRFTYWPVRFDRGGEMLAPGAPTDPIQILDVRDLGEWIVHCIENQITGLFNACGPGKPWTMGGVIDDCKAASGKDTKVTWVDGEFLRKQGEEGDGPIPIWVPYAGAMKGFHKYSNARAVKAGLKFREPLATVKDTLAWFKAQTAERQKLLEKRTLSAERETAILEAWRESRAPEPAKK
jgi:2'-hydroxyisoflavone reductase